MRIANSGEHFYNLKPSLEELAELIEDDLTKKSKSLDKLKKYIIKRFVDKLKECADHLEKSR